MKASKPSTSSAKKQIICKGCKEPFPSKNALFRHLRLSAGKCLTPEEYDDFMKYVVNREENCEKIAVLYGYIPSDKYLRQGCEVHKQSLSSLGSGDLQNSDDDTPSSHHGLRDGEHAAQLLLEAIQIVSLGKDIENEEIIKKSPNSCSSKLFKANRSYGCNTRQYEIVNHLAQDSYTGALNEVMSLKTPPLIFNENFSEEEKNISQKVAVEQWISKVNKVLRQKISYLVGQGHSLETGSEGQVKVFGRISVPKKFNAESNVSHRRIDYLLPADFLYGPVAEASLGKTMEEFCELIPSFHPDHIVEHDNKEGVLTVLYKLKKLMQKFCSHVVERETTDADALLENKIKSQSDKNNEESDNKGRVTKKPFTDENSLNKTKDNSKKEKDYVLKRRRYHNFTPKMMAHEYLSYRRLDRFFHRATVRVNELKSISVDVGLQTIRDGSRPFAVLSLKGDLFLNGQVRAIIGLYIAIIRGLIHEDIVDCIFDEEYANLVPAPVLPTTGQYAAAAWYIGWEGKLKATLCPRKCDTNFAGWNTPEILLTLRNFEEQMHSSIIRAWSFRDEVDANVENNEYTSQSGSKWINTYLVPWSERAKEQLDNYRKWKKARDFVDESNSTSLTVAARLLPPLDSISSNVPKLYQKVLECLRDINSSNLWPSTTPKRLLVMVSSGDDAKKRTSLAVAHMKARSNTEERVSAYSYREGEGGASGSFSVGAMPGSQCGQPKGNKLFPELMKAAFALEIALYPDREPSSTIAVNRNAQFRPHVDNGAGAGQSTSLIVALGTFTGGELMVEGEKKCIRYTPLQFNGWTQRHWTLPFRGERYSLVWFTPKGCEGIRGIDLCA
mmetsp:Transcript_4650/g.6048  ORF Transcript_4650/g.6048 Transcript_4650/m.6048 type:complete len:840 (-) Transcript_4650:96-2615(-)